MDSCYTLIFLISLEKPESESDAKNDSTLKLTHVTKRILKFQSENMNLNQMLKGTLTDLGVYSDPGVDSDLCYILSF